MMIDSGGLGWREEGKEQIFEVEGEELRLFCIGNGSLSGGFSGAETTFPLKVMIQSRAFDFTRQVKRGYDLPGTVGRECVRPLFEFVKATLFVADENRESVGPFVARHDEGRCRDP